MSSLIRIFSQTTRPKVTRLSEGSTDWSHEGCLFFSHMKREFISRENYSRLVKNCDSGSRLKILIVRMSHEIRDLWKQQYLCGGLATLRGSHWAGTRWGPRRPCLSGCSLAQQSPPAWSRCMRLHPPHCN